MIHKDKRPLSQIDRKGGVRRRESRGREETRVCGKDLAPKTFI